jgi:hypothetical protein
VARKLTSSGVPFADLDLHTRLMVEWIDGVHGPAASQVVLPSLSSVPVPQQLLDLPRLHPDRPRGSRAMIDAHAAKSRLRGCRPGAWLVSPRTGWRWAVWPGGEVGWLPKSVELPIELRVSAWSGLMN